MVPTGPFSDAELRRALLTVASNDRPVDPAVVKELAERAELWSNETVIRWTIVGEGHQTVGPQAPFRRSVLEDDSGTRYDAIVSGGGGDKYVTHRYDRFAGAVPDGAQRLLFTPWDDVTLNVTPDSIEPVDRIPIPLC